MILVPLLLASLAAADGGPRIVLALPAFADEQELLELVRVDLEDLGAEVALRTVSRWPKPVERQLARCDAIARKEKAQVVVWFAPNRPRAVSFCAPEPGGSRVVSRALPDAGRSRPAVLQLVGRVIRTFVNDLIVEHATETADAAVDAVPTAAPAEPVGGQTEPVATRQEPPTPMPTQAEPPSRRLAARVGLGVVGLAPQHTIVPSLHLGVQILLVRGLLLRGAGGFQVPATVEAAGYDLRLESFPFELSAVWQVDLGALRLGLSVAGVAVLRHWKATVKDDMLAPTAASSRWVWGSSLALEVEWGLWQEGAIFARGGVDLYANENRYGLGTDETWRTVVAPWPTPLWLRVGVSHGLL